MLCKVKTPTVIKEVTSVTQNIISSSWVNITSAITLTEGGYLEFSVDMQTNYYYGYFQLNLNGSPAYSYTQDPSKTVHYHEKKKEYLPVGTQILPQARQGSTSSSTVVSNYVLRIYDHYIEEDKMGIRLLPRELKGLGVFTVTTLYGNHIDNTFVGIYSDGYSTGATIGEVTLPNAKGYITLVINGERVKVPYYDE